MSIVEENRYAGYPRKTYRDLLEAFSELSNEQLDMLATVRVGDSTFVNIVFCYIFDDETNDTQMDEGAFEVYADYCANLPILEVDSSNLIALNKNQVFLNLGESIDEDPIS